MDQIHILLVEDNEGDILLIREAFEEVKLINKLSVVKDGKAAIEFLTKIGKYKNEGLPDLLLLDVNLPKINGHEVLQFIKNSENLKHLPVIMLTTSSSEKDIVSSYKNYVNCYITKPVEVGAFLEVVAKIKSFWFSIVKLPTKASL